MKIQTAFLVFCFSVTASAQTLRQQLQEFHRNPAAFMARLPPKAGRAPRAPFSKKDVETGDFLLHKDGFRKNLCRQIGSRRFCPALKQRGLRNFAEIDVAPQSIESFIEGGPIVRSARVLERYKEGRVRQQPWSDTYWPLYRGGLGDRYADPNYPRSSDWAQNFRYAMNLDIFAEPQKERLSPSEKYDFLVGDRQKTLTRANWDQGRYYQETYGSVERWMGLCHGWAPASYMLPRPKRSVVVKTSDGTQLKFLPSDIKGLATQLWASTNTNTLFIGGRCNDKKPKVDENGRVIDTDCFDTNPGLFHVLLINRIQQSRPFIFDASYDYEVWNQPVLGYSNTFFNPQTLQETDTAMAAAIPLEQYTIDKFKRYRSPSAKYVVGIQMRVAYLAETQATVSETNSPSEDSGLWAAYTYDLELDGEYNIIGGEWYNNAHPDFVWTPSLGSKALSVGDYSIQERWQQGAQIPGSWLGPAVQSSRHAQPLAHVVESLLAWAQ